MLSNFATPKMRDMKESFYSNFTPTSLDEWEEKILKDLKDKTIEDVSKTTQDGITIKPHYNRESVPHNSGIEGVSPYLRGLKPETGQSEVVEIIEGENIAQLNKEILAALNSGATALQINTANPSDLSRLLREVDLRYITTYFNGQQPAELIEAFEKIALKNEGAPAQIKGNYGFDPLGNSLIKGVFENTNVLFQNIATRHKSLPRFGFITVNAKHYHNAGATQAQEIGFALAQGHQYLAEALEAGIPLDEFTARIQFKTACGSEYLAEIAKIRALRSLWAFLVDRYQPEFECSSATKIYSETSSRFTAVADEYNNLVRNTVQCMAGIIGGADAVSVLPYNHAYSAPTPFSRRMARNTSLILQEESFFNKVIDPAGGSYLLDYLTNELAHKAWGIFQTVERQGGFSACLQSNFIQDTVLTNSKKQLEDFENGKRVMVGVNKFVNQTDDITSKLRREKTVEAAQNTDFKPLLLSRIAENTERKLAK